jgi:hypothetical protein
MYGLYICVDYAYAYKYMSSGTVFVGYLGGTWGTLEIPLLNFLMSLIN